MKEGYRFEFSRDENFVLLRDRGISFEQIMPLIERDCIVDMIDHPNQNKYPNQKIYIVEVDGYCCLVPYIVNGDKVFLKTIIPSRKATKDYIKKQRQKL